MKYTYKGDSRGQSRLEKMHLPFPYPRLNWDAVRECLTETKNTKCISAASSWSARGGSDGVCRTTIGDDHVCYRRRSLLPSEVNAAEHEHETAVVVAEDHWCLGAWERRRSLEVETTAAGEEWRRWETERRDCISQERKKSEGVNTWSGRDWVCNWMGGPLSALNKPLTPVPHPSTLREREILKLARAHVA